MLLVVSTILLLVLSSLRTEAQQSQASPLAQHINQLEASGDMAAGVSAEMRYREQIIQILIAQNNSEQAVAYLNDMRSFIHAPALEQIGLITSAAIVSMDEAIDTLILELQGGNPSPNQETETLPIVVNGEAKAVVVVADQAEEQTMRSANQLVDYVHKSTGVLLSVYGASELGGGTGTMTRIEVGLDAFAPDSHVDAALDGVKEDGFLIHMHGSAIRIAGPSVWGTHNGVLEFLERYVGVRWLFPGPDGEDVPQHASLSIEREDVRQEPAFAFRMMSPYGGSPAVQSARQPYFEWAQNNRLQGNYNKWKGMVFMHNLFSLFPVEEYGTTHPEYYPGHKAPDRPMHGWQPCFTEPGTVTTAVDRILAYFAANPNQTFFSLGVNDSVDYCETNPTHPAYPGQLNSIGLVNMSDIYYAWVNEVAEQVLQVYPDKWFGVLAYKNVMDPPSFPLHERVVPVLTKDRMAWADENVRDDGEAQNVQWSAAASQLAWYDYLYGIYYTLPRVYPHLMAEQYEYAKEHEVIAHYTEIYDQLGDGPKAWLAAKLQWDPDQDVDALLMEWYERMVGPAAAPDIQAYFDVWEKFWTDRVLESPWFGDRKNSTYLSISDASYLNLVAESDLTTSRQLLASAVAKAGTVQQHKRALLLEQSFDYYEASARSYPKLYERPQQEQDALDLLTEVTGTLESRLAYAAERHDHLEAYNDEIALAFPPSSLPLVDWTGWNASAFWYLAAYMKEEEPLGGAVTQQVQLLANTSPSAPVRDFARLLLRTGSSMLSLSANASFEEGGAQAAAWQSWIPTFGTIQRTEQVSHRGTASLKVEGMVRGGPYQTFAVKPGLTAAQVYYYTPPQSGTAGTIQLNLHLKDAQGKTLKSIVTSVTPLARTAGEWSSVSILEDVPAAVQGSEVKQIQVVITLDGMEQDALVYLDDAEVFQYEEEWVTAQTLWPLVDEIRTNEPNGGPLTQQVNALAQQTEPSDQREFARLLLAITSGSAASITENDSFEMGTTAAPPWGNWLPSTGTIARSGDEARTGQYSLAANGLQLGGPYQYVVPQTGPFAAQAYVKLPPGQTSSGTMRLYINLTDAQKKIIGTYTSPSYPVDTSGQWKAIRYAGWIPDDVNQVDVSYVQVHLRLSGIEAGTTLYIDDAVLYQ
ncbi:DUF4838 domain-containing protein [Paenibacillus sp. GYB004]|uniref:DUF4838 domain-containing protein n=1 Tax=Paenibacillus sp. GYB004 TaxID=2994393 RepID=UPI002F967051